MKNNFILKLSIVFVSCILMLTSVNAYDEDKTFKNDATYTAENFINASQSHQRSNGEWDGVTIVDEVKLYDFNDDISGYLYITENLDGSNGYITVLNNGGKLQTVEASVEPFPFDLSSKLYCVSALGYYNKTKNGFLDLRTQEVIHINSFVSNSTYSVATTRASDIFQITNLSYSITKIQQPGSRGCAPTIAAIIIDYHDRNMGKDNLISDSETIYTVQDTLISTTNALAGSVDLSRMKSKLTEYIVDKGYKAFISYETTENENGTLIEEDFYTVLTEICYERPVMVVIGYDGYVNKNNILNNSSTLHTLAVVGVKESTSGGTHYLKCYDPFDKQIREVIWDTENGDREYFAIYGVEYVNIR